MDDKGASEANTYATVKTVAQGLYDIAVVSSNASVLSQLLKSTRSAVPQYDTILALIILSLCLNLLIGLALGYVAFQQPEKNPIDGKNHIPLRVHRINAFATVLTMLMTMTNVILASIASGTGFQTNVSTVAPGNSSAK